MPVEAVYVILDGAPGPDSASFVEIETEARASVRIEAGYDPERPDYWRIGPLYRRTGEVPAGFAVEEQVAARIAANDLIAISATHEQEEHGGEPCVDNRAGIVAFVAHSLGLGASNMSAVEDALARYGEHHH